MSKALLERAEKLRAKFKALEAKRGSGHHPEDTDPSQAHLDVRLRRKVAPTHQGLPFASTHLMAFFDHDDLEQVHFVGPDAEAALAAVQGWAKQQGPVHNLPPDRLNLVLKTIPSLKLDNADGLPRLTVWLCDWNAVLLALTEAGVGISGGPLVHDGLDTTP